MISSIISHSHLQCAEYLLHSASLWMMLYDTIAMSRAAATQQDAPDISPREPEAMIVSCGVVASSIAFLLRVYQYNADVSKIHSFDMPRCTLVLARLSGLCSAIFAVLMLSRFIFLEGAWGIVSAFVWLTTATDTTATQPPAATETTPECIV